MIQDDISISYKYNEWIPFRHGIENHPSVFFVLFTESPMRTWDDLRCSTVSSTWPSSRPRPSRQVLPWLGHQKIAVGQPPNLQRRPFLRWGSQGLYDIIWSWCIMMYHDVICLFDFWSFQSKQGLRSQKYVSVRPVACKLRTVLWSQKKKRNWVSWWHLTKKLGLSIGCSALINYFC